MIFCILRIPRSYLSVVVRISGQSRSHTHTHSSRLRMTDDYCHTALQARPNTCQTNTIFFVCLQLETPLRLFEGKDYHTGP